jgi:hypothetical protein
LSDARKPPSLEEMWRMIENFGINRETFLLTNPRDEDVLELYQLIRKRIHDKRDQETVKRLREYCEKLKVNSH